MCRSAFDLAIRFNLHIATDSAAAGHGLGEFGAWFGISDSPLLLHSSDALLASPALQHHTVQAVGKEKRRPWRWFRHVHDSGSIDVWQPNQVFNYQPLQGSSKGWGYQRTVGRLHRNSGTACTYPRQILRQVFWSVPSGRRDRCRAVMRHYPPPRGRRNATGTQRARSSSPFDWTIAVHVRRGDAVTLGKVYRLLPMGYYVGMTNTVLRAIAKLQPKATVGVVVMSEGVNGTLIDVFGRPVEWAGLPKCAELGLDCTLMHGWKWLSTLQTVDCMATVDVLVGSISSFSHLARALSSNVHILPKYWMAPKQDETGTYDNGDLAQDTLGYVSPHTDGRWGRQGVPGVTYGSQRPGESAPPKPVGMANPAFAAKERKRLQKLRKRLSLSNATGNDGGGVRAGRVQREQRGPTVSSTYGDSART